LTPRAVSIASDLYRAAAHRRGRNGVHVHVEVLPTGARRGRRSRAGTSGPRPARGSRSKDYYNI